MKIIKDENTEIGKREYFKEKGWDPDGCIVTGKQIGRAHV